MNSDKWLIEIKPEKLWSKRNIQVKMEKIIIGLKNVLTEITEYYQTRER